MGFRQSRRTRRLTKLRAPTGPISTRNNRRARSKLTSITGRAVSLLRKEAHSLSALPVRHVVARRPPRSYISFITFPAISHLPTPLKRVHWRVDPPLLRSDVVRCRGSASQTSQLPCPIPGRPGRSQREQISSMHAHSILVTLKFVIQASAQKYQQGYRGGAHDERTSPTQRLHAT